MMKHMIYQSGGYVPLILRCFGTHRPGIFHRREIQTKHHLMMTRKMVDNGFACDAYLLPPVSPNCSEGALGRGQGAREEQRRGRGGRLKAGRGTRPLLPYCHITSLLPWPVIIPHLCHGAHDYIANMGH